jgi:hypothetical protein
MGTRNVYETPPPDCIFGHTAATALFRAENRQGSTPPTHIIDFPGLLCLPGLDFIQVTLVLPSFYPFRSKV